MRKTTAMLLALLLASLIAVSVLPMGLPSDTLVSGPVEKKDETTLVAENRLMSSRIYTLDENGEITSIYRESRLRDGRESSILRITAQENSTYFIRVMENGTDWELVHLENNSARVLYRGIFENAVTVTGLSVSDQTFWITAIGESRAIFVYEYVDGGEMKLKLVHPAWWLRDVVSAEFDGEQIRATTDEEDYVFVTPTGEKTYTDLAMETPIPEVKADGWTISWLLCKQTSLIFALILWLFVSLTLLISIWICHKADRLASRMTAVGAEAVFLSLLASVGFLFYMTLQATGVAYAWSTVLPACVAAGVIWLICVLLMRGAAGNMTALLPVLTKQMEGIVDGHVTPREVKPGKDELHTMDRSMQEMCMGLSIRDYEMKSTIRSYRRFVPDELTELLDRAVIAEVSLGDSRRVDGNVGLFSIGNRTSARSTLEDATFVNFINHSFGILNKCVEENHGCFLSSGLRMSAMETMFPRAAADGVRAGLDFLGQTRVKPVEGMPSPRPLLILHRTSFLYGIVGQEDRLSPYISSAELEFLSGYAQQFYEAGVRIVATEAYWNQMKEGAFRGRYIGFVSDPEKGFAYKLYEVLDAYPELERELRRGYDQRLQEAINLFYRNDFYLARNLLSSLLRACPGDGIVRWYLFACERFFNQEGDAEPDYRLFGIDE